MKQSIGLVILQITGIVLGLFSVFYVAANIEAKVYAIVGVQAVIIGLVSTFSNTGLDTYATRNVLDWKENGQDGKIRLIVSQAIISRTILATVLQAPIMIYIYYISASKFNSEYLGLFILMSIFSIPKATLDACALILKSFNRYFLSALLQYIVQVFGKILALVLFSYYGFEVYIITLIVLPVVVLIPVLVILRKYISFNLALKRKMLAENIGKSWKFALSSYLSYPFNYLDSLLVSILLPPEIFGSFTMGKRIFLMAKMFIENIFDPLIQKLVKFKSNILELSKRLKKIVKIQTILLILGLLFLIPIVLFVEDLILFLGIDHYKYLGIFLVCIFISQLLHVLAKVKLNFIMLFYSSTYYLITTILMSALSIIFIILVLQFDNKYIFMYSILTYLSMLIYSVVVFSKEGGVNNLLKEQTEL